METELVALQISGGVGSKPDSSASVTLSVCGRWMYWTDWEEDPKDSKRGKIERAWMDGSNRNIFITSKTVLWPNGLSLDIPAKILYWVDAFYDRIEMVYLNGTERKASGGPVGSQTLVTPELEPWAAEPLSQLATSAVGLFGG